jgi:hypothetical protein
MNDGEGAMSPVEMPVFFWNCIVDVFGHLL